MREDQFLRQRLQKEIPIEISPVLRDLISAIALIWIIWFQYKEKNHLIYMNIVKSRNFVIKFSANP